MKKLFLLFLFFIAPDSFAASCGNPWNCSGFTDGVAIGDKATNVGGGNFSCDQKNSGYTTVSYGSTLVLPFPYKAKCCDCDGSYDQWMKKPALCSGLSAGITSLPANSTASFDNQKLCWSFMCNKFYKLNSTSSGCEFDSAACLAQDGYKVSNGACMPETWCSGDWKSTFNSVAHFTKRVGGCDEYRCYDGGFASAADKTCVNASPDKTCGGSYPGENGVITQCPKDKQLTKANVGKETETYSCAVSCVAVSNSDMQKCFRCMDADTFKKCVVFKGHKSDGGDWLDCAKCTSDFKSDKMQCWN